MTDRNWQTFKEQFEKMPIYGKGREHDQRLVFGQYLTVLKEWWAETERARQIFEKKLAELLDDDKVCDGCGFFDQCEDEPYDCNTMDALRQIAGKEAK